MGERPSGIAKIYPGLHGLSDDNSVLIDETCGLIRSKSYRPKIDGKRYCSRSWFEGGGFSSNSINSVPIIVNKAHALTVHLRRVVGFVCSRDSNIANAVCQTLE